MAILIGGLPIALFLVLVSIGLAAVISLIYAIATSESKTSESNKTIVEDKVINQKAHTQEIIKKVTEYMDNILTKEENQESPIFKNFKEIKDDLKKVSDACEKQIDKETLQAELSGITQDIEEKYNALLPLIQQAGNQAQIGNLSQQIKDLSELIIGSQENGENEVEGVVVNKKPNLFAKIEELKTGIEKMPNNPEVVNSNQQILDDLLNKIQTLEKSIKNVFPTRENILTQKNNLNEQLQVLIEQEAKAIEDENAELKEDWAGQIQHLKDEIDFLNRILNMPYMIDRIPFNKLMSEEEIDIAINYDVNRLQSALHELDNKYVKIDENFLNIGDDGYKDGDKLNDLLSYIKSIPTLDNEQGEGIRNAIINNIYSLSSLLDSKQKRFLNISDLDKLKKENLEEPIKNVFPTRENILKQIKNFEKRIKNIEEEEEKITGEGHEGQEEKMANLKSEKQKLKGEINFLNDILDMPGLINRIPLDKFMSKEAIEEEINRRAISLRNALWNLYYDFREFSTDVFNINKDCKNEDRLKDLLNYVSNLNIGAGGENIKKDIINYINSLLSLFENKRKRFVNISDLDKAKKEIINTIPVGKLMSKEEIDKVIENVIDDLIENLGFLCNYYQIDDSIRSMNNNDCKDENKLNHLLNYILDIPQLEEQGEKNKNNIIDDITTLRLLFKNKRKGFMSNPDLDKKTKQIKNKNAIFSKGAIENEDEEEEESEEKNKGKNIINNIKLFFKYKKEQAKEIKNELSEINDIECYSKNFNKYRILSAFCESKTCTTSCKNHLVNGLSKTDNETFIDSIKKQQKLLLNETYKFIDETMARSLISNKQQRKLLFYAFDRVLKTVSGRDAVTWAKDIHTFQQVTSYFIQHHTQDIMYISNIRDKYKPLKNEVSFFKNSLNVFKKN